METIKESLLKDVKNSGKGGFFYYHESSRDESAINVMHGGIASGSLRNCYYSYMLGEKSLFEQFLPRIIRLCEKAIELKIEVSWRPSHVCLIYEAYAGAIWLYTGQDNIDIWKECLAQTNLWFLNNEIQSIIQSVRDWIANYFIPIYNAVYLPKNTNKA
ncbi:hypothetical protein ACGTJS_13170 [Faucicola mancuniensis]|uniref:hypothetical protein n=1 Tax=Faucicola mancuniensis TaxID=1309795 RepID=UPI00397753C2